MRTNMSTTTNKKRWSVVNAMTAIGEVALTITISGAALLAVGIGSPPVPAAQAHAVQAIVSADNLTSEA